MKANLWAIPLVFLAVSGLAFAQSPTTTTKKSSVAKSPGTQAVAPSERTPIKQVPPVYPEQAKNAGVQGSVSLHVTIGIDGAVKKLTVVSGPPSLTQAAMDAVGQWRYKPYLFEGKPVEVETTVVVNFQLTQPVQPLPWWVVVTEVAKGVPSSQIMAELKQRQIDFPYDTPLDALHEKLFRSLGASGEVVEAARHARLLPTQEFSDSEKKLLAPAETDVRNLIAKSLENAGLHELLAMILMGEMSNRDDAVMELRKAVLLAPDSPSARFYLGMSLLGPEPAPQVAAEAIYNFRESLRLAPDQFEGHLGLGFALRSREEWDESIQEFQRALEIAQSPIARSDLHEEIGDVHLAQKQYDLAANDYREAFDGSLEKAHLHLSLGIALYDQGDYRSALVAFRNYLWLRKSGNTSEVGQNWLAASLYQLGQYSESIAQANIALEAYPKDKTAKTWLAGATAKLQAAGADGPQQARPIMVVQASGGGGAGCDPNWSPRFNSLTADPDGMRAAIKQKLEGLIAQYGGLDGTITEVENEIQSDQQREDLSEDQLQALVSMNQGIIDILKCRQGMATNTGQPSAGGGLAGTTWACNVSDNNTLHGSFLLTLSFDGRYENHQTDDALAPWAPGGHQPGDRYTVTGTQITVKESGQRDWWDGTISGSSISGDYVHEDDNGVRRWGSFNCSLQSSAVQSNSGSGASSGGGSSSSSYSSSGLSGSSRGQSSSSSTQNAGGVSGSTAGGQNSTNADAKVEGKPASSADNPSDYVDPASQCGHAQIEANTLYIVNQCGFTVDATYTSQGDIWGETPLAPGEHHRTAYSADAVSKVGIVSVYTCPGSGTAVDPSGLPVAPSPIYTGREYRCHR